MMPDGFVSLGDRWPQLHLDIRYATHHNLTGRPLAGYLAPKAIAVQEASEALGRALHTLEARGLGLLIYDAYRPCKAVQSFVDWSLAPEDGTTKAEFYPELRKEDLFPQGYIALRSGHSRGATIDLTLTDAAGTPLDMGTTFDLMSGKSHHGAAGVTALQTQNRALLCRTMEEAGFVPYDCEWWHYRLAKEPYPDTYFDFDIE